MRLCQKLKEMGVLFCLVSILEYNTQEAITDKSDLRVTSFGYIGSSPLLCVIQYLLQLRQRDVARGPVKFVCI
jgi:hypothetical protein